VRVLFTATPGYGHVFPMIPLAKAFLAAGHEVRWVTSADLCPVVAGAGLDVTAAGLAGDRLQALEQNLLPRRNALPPDQRAEFMFPARFGEGLAPAMLPELLAIAREWRPDLVVHEHGELAAPLVGRLVGARIVTHAFGGGIPAAFVAEAGERVRALWSEHGLDLPPHAGCYADGFLDICPAAVQSVPIDHVPNRMALRPVAYSGQDTSWEPPPGDDPLVYLTLGTVHVQQPLLALALESLADLDLRVLVALGPEGDQEVLGPHPSNVTLSTWVPQAQVLPHCAVVVSHAGSGTFLGALAAGVPQLCLPQAADQFRNAAGGVRAGAALWLPPDQVSGPAVVTAVQRLLVEPSFRTAAAGVADDVGRMPSPADVVALLVSR
jgi:UDP:flavonoid glycosyltransferase YjiC (YdhE family)